VRRPDRTFATPDHYVSTLNHDLASINEPHRRGVVEDLEANAKAAGLTLFGLTDRRQGIVHVVGPEQGLSQPGMIMVCGDSHTATHGALGALAFGSALPRSVTYWRPRPCGKASRRICGSSSTARWAPAFTLRT
jgi:3-isopropylmalate/(R)-2-methylmalate dehydratase large subunit